MAGLLGAGLLGALFGNGFFGGLGGLASMLGLLLQVALIGGLIYLALRFFRRRSEPQPAYAGALGQALGARRHGSDRSRPRGRIGRARRQLGGRAPLRRGASAATRWASARTTTRPSRRPCTTSRPPMAARTWRRSWNLATPEMAGYFQEELNENARNNAINKISDVRLLQGDLAEAWREGATDYATVAMRYALKDVTLDRTTGRVVEGDRDNPQE